MDARFTGNGITPGSKAWKLRDENPIAFQSLADRWKELTAKTARYEFSAKKGKGEILLYGPIGFDFFGDGITAKQFVKELRALGEVKDIALRIDSPGGSVTDAAAIYSNLRETRARIRVHIDGMAASAASYIAMIGDDIEVGESSLVMIHNARGGTYGTAAEMRKQADVLDKVSDQIASAYIARTGNDRKTVQAWMDDEKWFTGPEAMDAGFATELVENKGVTACLYPEAFAKMPSRVKPLIVEARKVLGAR